MTIDLAYLESLLNSHEGALLDFKQAQYPLSTEDEKGELVKDIVAMANRWERGPAHIVIGAREEPGKRAVITGVAQHHDDATLQQVVNGKLNRPVQFEYIAITADRKSIAIIRIPDSQQRPFFLVKKFGKIQPNTVYVRRGSSTGQADLDEVARMGMAAATTRPEPTLEFELYDTRSRQTCGDALECHSRRLVRAPRKPVDQAVMQTLRRLSAHGHSELSYNIGPSLEELWEFRVACALLTPVHVTVCNVGTSMCEDVNLILRFDHVGSVKVYEKYALPERPMGKMATLRIPRSFDASRTSVVEEHEGWVITMNFGKLQAGATERSDAFWISSTSPAELTLEAELFGDQLSKPLAKRLKLRMIVSEVNDSSLPEPDDSSLPEPDENERDEEDERI